DRLHRRHVEFHFSFARCCPLRLHLPRPLPRVVGGTGAQVPRRGGDGMKGEWAMARLSVLIGVALALAGCAKELSEEERRREHSEREYHRLLKAEGEYRGYLLAGEGRRVPFEILVTVQRNPAGGETVPEVQASMRVGLFGGVKIASSG